METFQNVFQPRFEEVYEKDYALKGSWAEEVFDNHHPIVLELGCGKGEYTVGQAELDTRRNFIGVDIKGARIWRGARTANDKALQNVAFLRTRIEVITSFFASGEIDEIWITFPDPQLKRRRHKKRLTGPLFLNRYRQFLKDNGIVHLKTDNDQLFRYTRELASHNRLEIIHESDDLYHAPFFNETLAIQTAYEKQFISEGLSIRYIAFRLPSESVITEITQTNG
ncbi:MAG: tRNA (guanosine(46)-N7)-methyltransferase TrmB [Bacteroidales bacterium]|nr:tRNA (guanosine(46)-N7)-methyltransferase TrmB [Bacteroidales bacterium]